MCHCLALFSLWLDESISWGVGEVEQIWLLWSRPLLYPSNGMIGERKGIRMHIGLGTRLVLYFFCNQTPCNYYFIAGVIVQDEDDIILNMTRSNFFLDKLFGRPSCARTCYSRTSLKESKRTVVVPDRSISWFWHKQCFRYIIMCVCIDFEVLMQPWRPPSPTCLHFVILESWRTLEIPDRSLSWFWHNECSRYILLLVYIELQVSM